MTTCGHSACPEWRRPALNRDARLCLKEMGKRRTWPMRRDMTVTDKTRTDLMSYKLSKNFISATSSRHLFLLL